MEDELKQKFNFNMDAKEFEKIYFYKTELQKICRENKINPYGTKAELEKRIKKLLSGETAEEENTKRFYIKKRKKETVEKEITLETKLLDGFKFNNKVRDFFAGYFKIKKFSFTKEMASLLRYAEKNQNFEITVKDLIEVYLNKEKYKGKFNFEEEKTYEWNNFVKNFNRDLKNIKFSNRMKTASILWNKVKNGNGEKTYTRKLFEENFSEIKEFIIENIEK